jgi:hypothetical protein
MSRQLGDRKTNSRTGAVVQLYVQHAWHLSVLLHGPPLHGRNCYRRFIGLQLTEQWIGHWRASASTL